MNGDGPNGSLYVKLAEYDQSETKHDTIHFGKLCENDSKHESADNVYSLVYVAPPSCHLFCDTTLLMNFTVTLSLKSNRISLAISFLLLILTATGNLCSSSRLLLCLRYVECVLLFLN
jgi:hypothetical protein